MNKNFMDKLLLLEILLVNKTKTTEKLMPLKITTMTNKPKDYNSLMPTRKKP
jgi:hypothetical protein